MLRIFFKYVMLSLIYNKLNAPKSFCYLRRVCCNKEKSINPDFTNISLITHAILRYMFK